MQLEASKAEVSRLQMSLHGRDKEDRRVEKAQSEIKELYELMQVVNSEKDTAEKERSDAQAQLRRSQDALRDVSAELASVKQQLQEVASMVKAGSNEGYY